MKVLKVHSQQLNSIVTIYATVTTSNLRDRSIIFCVHQLWGIAQKERAKAETGFILIVY